MNWRREETADATILRSRDAGKTWDEANHGLPSPMRHNIEGMCSAGYPGGFSLFIGDTEGNVWGSDDEAESWRLVVSGLAPISKGGHFRAFQPVAA